MKTLEKIANYTKAALCAAVIAAATSCTTNIPITKFKHNDSGSLNSQLAARTGLEIGELTPHLSEEQKYVSIHPADGGASRGGRSLDISSSYDFSTVNCGLEASTGTEWLRLKAGADLRYHSSFFKINIHDGLPKEVDSQDDLTSVELQSLPFPYESYAYGQVRRNDLASIDPFVGIEVIPWNKFYFGFEFSKPKAEFEFEKGDWRWNTLSPRENSSWEGSGTRYAFGLGCKDFPEREDYPVFCISYIYEKYPAEFTSGKTDIDNKIIALLFRIPLER